SEFGLRAGPGSRDIILTTQFRQSNRQVVGAQQLRAEGPVVIVVADGAQKDRAFRGLFELRLSGQRRRASRRPPGIEMSAVIPIERRPAPSAILAPRGLV